MNYTCGLTIFFHDRESSNDLSATIPHFALLSQQKSRLVLFLEIKFPVPTPFLPSFDVLSGPDGGLLPLYLFPMIYSVHISRLLFEKSGERVKGDVGWAGSPYGTGPRASCLKGPRTCMNHPLQKRKEKRRKIQGRA